MPDFGMNRCAPMYSLTAIAELPDATDTVTVVSDTFWQGQARVSRNTD